MEVGFTTEMHTYFDTIGNFISVAMDNLQLKAFGTDYTPVQERQVEVKKIKRETHVRRENMFNPK